MVSPDQSRASGPILILNSGSSSLKFAVYHYEDGEERQTISGVASNIGRPGGHLEIKDGDGQSLADKPREFPSAEAALGLITDQVARHTTKPLIAIGHRIVHGGPRLRDHQRITPAVVRILEESVHFAPLHIPPALALIRDTEARFPALPQIACFDTAFHRTLPETASRFPLPRSLWEAGILRYGFHGLSYESIVAMLGEQLRPRTVIAHLGNGCSLAALRDGVSVDTSMGLTPAGGIPMSTRSGDLDPGVLLYLLRSRRFDLAHLESLLNGSSGLAGLSNGESDMRRLQAAAQAGDSAAALAIEIFCRSIAKTVGAYATVLSGLDMLVFTAGIGENSAMVRRQVVDKLAFLGIQLDPAANQQGRRIISTPDSACEVWVLRTDEDRQIARHSRRLLQLEI